MKPLSGGSASDERLMNRKKRHQHRHGIGEAAKLRDFVRVAAVVEHADRQGRARRWKCRG